MSPPVPIVPRWWRVTQLPLANPSLGEAKLLAGLLVGGSPKWSRMGWGMPGPGAAQPCQARQGLAERVQLSLGPAGWSRVRSAWFGPGHYRALHWPAGWAWQCEDSCWRRIWRGCLDRYRWSWDDLVGSGGETSTGLTGPPPFVSPSMVSAPPHCPRAA